MPKKLQPIWTAEGQEQRAAKRKDPAPVTAELIEEALRRYQEVTV